MGRRQRLPGEKAEATWREGRSYLVRERKIPEKRA